MKDGTDTRVEKTRSVGDVVVDRRVVAVHVAEMEGVTEGARAALIAEAARLAGIERAFREHGMWTSAPQLRRAAIATVLALLLGSLLALAAPAAAQTDVDRLMRTAWSECGIDCTDDEIAALHLVIASTAEREGVRYRTAWRLLSPRLAAGTVSRAWVAHIDHRCEEPSGWPTHVYERDGDVMRLVPHAPWSAYRERCEDLVRRVRLVLDGAIAHRCVSVPRSWGSEMDAARSVPGRRFVVVDCGETANVFGEWLAVDEE